MKFEWDEEKAEENLRKHGVTFKEACTVFGDWNELTYYDPDHSVYEERFLTLGMTSGGKILVVVHTSRGERIRLISARKATKPERNNYEAGIKKE